MLNNTKNKDVKKAIDILVYEKAAVKAQKAKDKKCLAFKAMRMAMKATKVMKVPKKTT